MHIYNQGELIVFHSSLNLRKPSCNYMSSQKKMMYLAVEVFHYSQARGKTNKELCCFFVFFFLVGKIKLGEKVI